MPEHSWSLGGTNLRLVLDGVDAELAALCLAGTDHLAPPAPGAPECEIRLASAEAPDPDALSDLELSRTLPIAKGPIRLEARVYRRRRDDALVVSLGEAATSTVDHATGRVSVLIHDEGFFLRRADPLYTSSVLFKSFLLELLPTRGLYPVHVGACRRDDVCVLIGGEPGAGTSSCLLALLERGFGYLGDELTFLRRDATGVTVVGFPIHGKVRGAAGARIPVAARRGVSDGAVVFDPSMAAATAYPEGTLTHVLTVRPGRGTGAARVEVSDAMTALETLLRYDVFYGTRHHLGQLEAASTACETATRIEVTLGEDGAVEPLEEVLSR